MIKYKNVKWNMYNGALIPRVPPHTEVHLTDMEAMELLSKSKAYLIWYTNEWDRPDGEFWYLIKDSFDGFNELKTKHRTQIRRGLKNCLVKRVGKEEIADNGYEVYKSAFDRYSTNLIPMTEDVFRSGILNSDYDNWAVYVKDKNRMIAYSQITIFQDSCNSTITKFNPAYLNLRPSEALFFEINKYYLGDKSYGYVSNGSRSISHNTNIQQFLEQKMNFRKAYCKLNIHYRNDIKLLISTLYPARHIIWKTKHKSTIRLSTILKLEEIRRGFNEH